MSRKFDYTHACPRRGLGPGVRPGSGRRAPGVKRMTRILFEIISLAAFALMVLTWADYFSPG